tara:strand:+ start:310 stop:483 length:174 start_codon:yes stop_codon:yes gene_type:complete
LHGSNLIKLVLVAKKALGCLILPNKETGNTNAGYYKQAVLIKPSFDHCWMQSDVTFL